jgi:hypothetical protein
MSLDVETFVSLVGFVSNWEDQIFWVDIYAPHVSRGMRIDFMSHFDGDVDLAVYWCEVPRNVESDLVRWEGEVNNPYHRVHSE